MLRSPEMWLLLAAHAQDCGIRTAVAGFPLGEVPVDAVSTVVLQSDCPLTAQLVVDGEMGTLHTETLHPRFDGPFQFFHFELPHPPLDTDLRFELGVNADGELARYVGGWYRFDEHGEGELDGVPQLADVVVGTTGDQITISAAVLPATSASEALLLWRLDGVLHEVTVSTQPRPTLITHPTGAPICLEVEEIGVDGSRATSEPRCVEPEAVGCGCGTAQGGFVGRWLRR